MEDKEKRDTSIEDKQKYKDSSEKNDKNLKEDNKDIKKSIKNKSGEIFNKIKKNPWIVSTIILVLVLIILLLLGSCNLSGNVVSKDVAGEKLLDFYKSQGVQSLELDSVEEVSGLYKVKFDYQGQEIPLFMTKDGKLAGQLDSIDLDNTDENSDADQNSQQKTEDIPQTDKPEVELFVMSFCPYGNQAEDTMEPVYDLLKDYADFEVNYIVSMNGDTVDSLHGQPEVDQNMREVCVKEEYGMNEFWDFVTHVNENCGSEGECWEEAASESGLDTEEIETCVDEKGIDFMKEEASKSQEAGATGSPTLLINGVESSEVYNYQNSEAYKQAVCSAFTEEARPSECDTELSSSSGSTTTGGSC